MIVWKCCEGKVLFSEMNNGTLAHQQTNRDGKCKGWINISPLGVQSKLIVMQGGRAELQEVILD